MVEVVAAEGAMEEAMVDKSPIIDQIMIYNNQSPYTIALVVASKEKSAASSATPLWYTAITSV